jgi:murein tripeptide amidase MpaA
VLYRTFPPSFPTKKIATFARLIATPEGELLLRHFDVLLMPVANPDGYDFSWTEDRFWQKNRNPNLGTK